MASPAASRMGRTDLLQGQTFTTIEEERRNALSIYENTPLDGDFTRAHAIVAWTSTSIYAGDRQVFWLSRLIQKCTQVFSYLDALNPEGQKDPIRAKIILENALSCYGDDIYSKFHISAQLGILLSFGDEGVPAEPKRAVELLETVATEYLKGKTSPNNLVRTACQNLVILYDKGAADVAVNRERAETIHAYFQSHYFALAPR